MENLIVVGLSELAISDDPQAVLVAYGLGSGVSMCGYDPVRKVGGMLYALLPQARNGDQNPNKCVDSGFRQLLAGLLSAGASRERIVWRIAGGAEMLTAPGLAGHFNIGAQNVAMAVEVLGGEQLPLLAADTGGHDGRTVRLYVQNGRVTVRKVGGEERAL